MSPSVALQQSGGPDYGEYPAWSLYRDHFPDGYEAQWADGRTGLLTADIRYGYGALPVLATLLRQIRVSDWYRSGWPFFFGLWQEHWRLQSDPARDPSDRAAARVRLNYRAFQDITTRAAGRWPLTNNMGEFTHGQSLRSEAEFRTRKL